jgi:uncharacterized protein (DUF302 family)
MKSRLILSVLLITTSLFASAQKHPMENPAVMIENESRFGFSETVDLLSKTIVESGWKVTIIHDLQETMKKNGKEVVPVKVIELCNPNHAYQILSKDELRSASPMLPCRISVYEKADGKTYVSRMNAPAFAGMIGGEAAVTIVKAFDETEVMLKGVLK